MCLIFTENQALCVAEINRQLLTGAFIMKRVGLITNIIMFTHFIGFTLCYSSQFLIITPILIALSMCIGCLNFGLNRAFIFQKYIKCRTFCCNNKQSISKKLNQRKSKNKVIINDKPINLGDKKQEKSITVSLQTAQKQDTVKVKSKQKVFEMMGIAGPMNNKRTSHSMTALSIKMSTTVETETKTSTDIETGIEGRTSMSHNIIGIKVDDLSHDDDIDITHVEEPTLNDEEMLPPTKLEIVHSTYAHAFTNTFVWIYHLK